MIQNTLQVIPHGLIQSGTVILRVDETTGLIDFSDTLVVGWSIFTKTLQNQQSIKIDPNHLKSANIKVGMTMTIGAVKLEVLSVSQFQAEVSCTYKDDDNDFTGNVTLDLEEEYFSVMHLIATGVSSKNDIQLELQA